MGLNIKNRQVEELAAEVARLTGETKTEAIRRALLERRDRLFTSPPADRATHLTAFLEREVWPRVPPEARGRRLSKRQRERILGIGHDGV